MQLKHSRTMDAQRSDGFTLIEVLVAVLILSIGIFGLIALESTALQNNQDAYVRSQVTVLIYDITDKMRSNMGTDYETVTVASAACVSYSGPPSSCNAAQVAGNDRYDWEQAIRTITSSGSGAIASSGAITTVTVSWDDDRSSASSVASISMSFEL
ncbi:MAG: type IV pilus modification protein PilV [Motiliproteus sp.]